MKKALATIVLFITFIFIYFLQTNFFNWFNIAGIKPNLFIFFALFIGLFIGKIYGITSGIIMGLLLDLFIGRKIGMNAISLGLAGFLGETFTKNFSKDSRMTIMLITLGATLICESVLYIIQIAVFNMPLELLSFLKIVLIETLFNVIIIIIIYPLIEKTGEVLTRIFKEKNILTKYY